MKTIDEYWEYWMTEIYPHNRYVNAIGSGWAKKFAQDYANYVIAYIGHNLNK